MHMTATRAPVRFAFSPRSVAVVAAILTLSVIGIRLAGLHYAIPVGLLYLLAVVVPCAACVAGVIIATERAQFPSACQPLIGCLLGLILLACYWPDRLWFLLPTTIGALVLLGRELSAPRDGSASCVIGTLLLIAAM
jgi:hypothetical protein